MTDETKTATEPPLDCLVRRLRALARYEHDDLSIGDEAAVELERLIEAFRQVKSIAARGMWHDEGYDELIYHLQSVVHNGPS